MPSILDSLAKYIGPEQVDQISTQLGASPEQTKSAIAAALPTILAGLARNAQDASGRQNLDAALERDHDGSLLENLGAIFGGQPQSAPVSDRAVAGGSILDHILGRKQERVAESVSQGSGLSSSQIMKLMMMLAPVVLAYLGRRRRQENLSPDGLGTTLERERVSIESASGGSMLGRLFDQDGDGDFDLMDIMKFGVSRMFGK